MIDGGYVGPSDSSSPPKMGEDWREDAAAMAVWGFLGGATVVAGGTAVLTGAAVGGAIAGVYGGAVGLKRLWKWARKK